MMRLEKDRRDMERQNERAVEGLEKREDRELAEFRRRLEVISTNPPPRDQVNRNRSHRYGGRDGGRDEDKQDYSEAKIKQDMIRKDLAEAAKHKDVQKEYLGKIAKLGREEATREMQKMVG
jgi:hypothetical protein